MDGTNHGILTSQTPINKKKVILNTRPETERTRGGQKGHTKHKLEKFEEKEITEYSEHQMEECPCCKEKTLILRILDYKEQYLMWVHNFEVPFTNNLSERGLRGVKSKQKASGQFWNIESAKYYATIRTYIETCQRNKVNVYNALLKLVLGKPYTLKEILSGISE